jgi:hypothetical protein
MKLEVEILENIAKGVAPPSRTLPWDRLAQIAYAAGEP